MKTIQKEHQIVLLPTNGAQPSYIKIKSSSFVSLQKVIYTKHNFSAGHINQHLYILSDEEIKGLDNLHNKSHEFGWYINIDNKSNYSLFNYQGGGFYGSIFKKIIATTNPELICHRCKGFGQKDMFTCICHNTGRLSKPTDEFIQQWIAKDCPEKINVEYEPQICQNCGQSYCDRYECKDDKNIDELIISSDNTITCSFIEDDWNSIFNELNRTQLKYSQVMKNYLIRNFNPPTKK